MAQDTRLNRPVALKLLPAYFAADDARLRLFQSEARAASALNHPNILTIYEVGENEGVYFIATEFIDGQTIRELIKERELSLEEVLEIVEQIASALSSAHAAGIVHRDIKPENIMRRTDGLLKILDFGIAKLIEPETTEELHETARLRVQTEAGQVMGTVSYMSPEQARGLAVDERTDIWSLGVVLYEMLTGRLPFSGATRMDTMVAILDREPAPLAEVVKERHSWGRLLQSIINRCLSKEVAERYGTMGELLADLKDVRESPIDEPRVGARAASARALRWTIVGVVAVLLIAAGAIILYRRGALWNAPPASATTAPQKLYAQMSERERLDFVAAQEHRISTMISDRPVKLNDDAVRVIKAYVDHYAGKLNPSGDAAGWRAVYERGQPYVPLIARSFRARKVPVVIGIYLPAVESGYRPCYESPLGSKGLFQFLPSTAAAYGVARDQMCDVEKMTPAAAHFIADRMAELGEDSASVTLVLLSYNRGENWVRTTLRQLRGTENYERDFWTILANRETLDDFGKESASYVPTFFAVAIIGENPAAFGLQTPALSTLADAQ
ncbi:MAG TPA: serine/threonine-protein kinase [Pyrinomonadaceae bacterium]|nr:serine/threonine-protein kinase [Pyrinomonadaceae bacterium]